MAALIQPSMSSGEISPKLHSRVDLARYLTALKFLRNFIVMPEGGVQNRAGTRFIEEIPGDGVLIPFIYSTEQTYMLVFTHEEIRVFANGGFVQSGGVNVVVPSPYQLEDLEQLRYAQSADVLTIVHKDYPQREFRRLTSTSFSLTAAEYVNGPFIDLNSDESIRVSSSAREGAVTLTSTVGIFTADHVGSLFYLEQENLSQIPPWESNKKLVGATGNPFGLRRRSDGKTYVCVTSQAASTGKEIWTGTVRPIHESGTEADGDGNALQGGELVERAGVAWEYRDSGYGIVRITEFTSATSVKATVLRTLPDAVVGGVTIGADWNDVGDGSSTAFPIAGVTQTDPNMFQVSINGVIQPRSAYEINVGTEFIEFYVPPPALADIYVAELTISSYTTVWAFGAWSEDQGYPSVVTYWQDRLVFAATRKRPKTVWGSKNGQYPDFGVSVPLIDDDAVDFTLNARQQNAIVDLLPLDSLIALTTAGAWKVTDGQNQVLTPTTVGFKPQSYKGAERSRTVIIGDAAIYVQAGGRKLRTLSYGLDKDKFSGINLSALASHLFTRDRTILDMDYAEEPQAQLWITRSDGRLVSCAYDPEQELIGFGRHDTKNGYFRRVCQVPEESENAVYFIVRRVINGSTKYFLERLANRDFEDLVDAVFVDASLTYDGRNTDSTTMTLSGSGWTVSDELTLNASQATFAASNINDEIWLRIETESQDERGEPITVRDEVKLRISEYVGTSQVRVFPLRDVPASFRGVAFTNWVFAKDTFQAAHLPNTELSVLADGEHRGTVTTSASGTFTISPPGGVVHAGIPMLAEGETLDANFIGQESIRGRAKSIPFVQLDVLDTRGVLAGPDRENLEDVAERSQDDYEAGELITGVLDYRIPVKHGTEGSIVFRQDKPLPTTIRAIIPEVQVGEAG